jgi:hypothetical protein
VITTLSPRTLREIASAMEARAAEKVAVDELTEEGGGPVGGHPAEWRPPDNWILEAV